MKGRLYEEIRALCAFGAIAALLAAHAAGQDLQGNKIDPQVQEEIDYAHGLIELGLPDFAEEVVKAIKDPSAKAVLKRIELQGLIARGQFDDVKAMIAKIPNQDSEDAWNMKLALGDGYYAWGRYAEAQGVYQSFFQKYSDGPPEGLNQFYVESAYKFAQMLLLMGQEKAALAAYESLKKAKLDKAVERQILSETAELLVKLAEETNDQAQRDEYFKKISAINDVILWVPDIWFGKAIVMMAHVEMIKGDIDKAMKLVEDYTPQLKDIEESLQEQEKETGEPLTRISPMAECRYLVGVIMEEQARKLIAENGNKDEIIRLLAGKKTGKTMSPGALQHFFNVFIRYPGSSWAPDAGEHGNAVKALLEEKFGLKIDVKITDEQLATVEKYQFHNAQTLYNQQQFGQAAEAYVKVLNLFPEGEMSIAALGELGRCYIELEDDLNGDVITYYLAERFSAHPTFMVAAGDQLLRNAEMYGERGLPEKKSLGYNLFFEFYTRHPRTPSILFQFGEKRFAEEDVDGALSYYLQIVEKYDSSPLCFDALNKAAFCYSRKENYVEEIKTLDKYLEKLEARGRPDSNMISARYRQAHAYKQLGEKYIPSALKRYNELVALLSDPKNPYQNTVEDKETNLKILEASIFYKGQCYAMVKDTDNPENERKYKLAAIKTLQELVTQFPKSPFAPVALNLIGTLWTVFDRPKEAGEAFKQLKDQYPDSEQANNVDFLLAKTLLDMGRRQQAVKFFKQMFQGGGTYSSTQILTAGMELFKVKEYQIACEAFDRIIASEKERALLEPAMVGRGEALIEMKEYAKGIEALEKVFGNYPNTGRTVEICFYLNRAYKILAMDEENPVERTKLFNKAVENMRKLRQFVQTDEGRAKSDIEVARISVDKAAAEEKYGDATKANEYVMEAVAAYQAMIWMSNFEDAKVRMVIEEAYYECTPLLLKAGKLQDVVDDVNKYLEQFPGGKHGAEMRGWRNQAQGQLAAQAALGGGQPQAEAPQAESPADNAAAEPETNEVGE